MNVDRLCWRLSSESPLLLQKKQTGPALESTVAFDRSAASGTFPLATNPLYDAIRWTGALCDVHLVVRWQMRWNILSPSACQSASHDLANGADNSIEMQLNWCVDYFCHVLILFALCLGVLLLCPPTWHFRTAFIHFLASNCRFWLFFCYFYSPLELFSEAWEHIKRGANKMRHSICQ